MLTIKIRIILAYTVLFGVVLGLFGWVIYDAVRDEQMSKLRPASKITWGSSTRKSKNNAQSICSRYRRTWTISAPKA